MIVADSEYVFSESDLKNFAPSVFFAAILEVSGLRAPSTLAPTNSWNELLQTPTEGGLPGWALGIIIPCIIAVILIPCWTLFCVSANKMLKFGILILQV